MKPLELSSVSEVWKSALTILTKNLSHEGTDIQLWFPWGKTWRGYEEQGVLPPTDLPSDLITPSGEKFAGRFWHQLNISETKWLLSLKAKRSTMPSGSLQISSEASSTLNLLGEFVKLECLLGLTLRILENCANERTGHWERVRNLCVAMGRQMKLTGRDLFDLELTALLHDIGKVALPSALLNQTRSLSPAERKQIETHSAIGAGMIHEIPGLEKVAEGVLYHHEAPDGSGYPKGLKSGEIPLQSLIVNTADTFDAMTHYRPYANEQTYKDAVKEMLNASGKFDDRVLWSLQEVLKNLGILETHPVSPS